MNKLIINTFLFFSILMSSVNASDLHTIDSTTKNSPEKVTVQQFGKIVKTKMADWLVGIDFDGKELEFIPVEFELNASGEIENVIVHSGDKYINFQVRRKLMGKSVLTEAQSANFAGKRFSTKLRFRSV